MLKASDRKRRFNMITGGRICRFGGDRVRTQRRRAYCPPWGCSTIKHCLILMQGVMFTLLRPPDGVNHTRPQNEGESRYDARERGHQPVGENSEMIKFKKLITLGSETLTRRW